MKNKNLFLRISLIVCALLICCLSFFVPNQFNSVSALEVESDYNFIPIDFNEFSFSFNETDYLNFISLGDGEFRFESFMTSNHTGELTGALSFNDSFTALSTNYYGFYFNFVQSNIFDYLTLYTSIYSFGFTFSPSFVLSSGFLATWNTANIAQPLGIGKVSTDTEISSFNFSIANFWTNSALYGQEIYFEFSLSYCDFGADYPTNIFDSLNEYYVGYDNGYDVGYNDAINKFGDIGYFNQSTWNAYFLGNDSFLFDSYQPVTTANFKFGNGGIYLTNTGIAEYVNENFWEQGINEESGYISFKKVGLVSDYTMWSYSGMIFGNRVIFIFSDGTSKSFGVADSDLNYGSSYLDLTEFIGKTIIEVQIHFANGDSAPGGNNTPIGIGSGTSFSLGFAQGYQSGLKDNQSDVYDRGYANGSANGYRNGYNEGLATAENTSFSGLISAVIDVPLKFITSIFNFEILGVNISSFLFALLSIAIIVTIIKLVSKNE